MTRIVLAIGLGLAVGAAGIAAQVPGATGTSGAPVTAGATLLDGEGRGFGEARLQQTPHGVLLTLELRNATPGVHAFHVHQVGVCQAPSFESAGAHLSPSGHEHGFLNPRGAHEGDLPNITVPMTKHASLEYLLSDVTLDPGPRSLLDANGSALVIHAGKDDYRSNPAGEAGDRLACGVIVRAKAS